MKKEYENKSIVPNLLIIGGAKCGTTTLAEFLNSSPSIFVPKIKEVRFFDDDLAYQGGLKYLESFYSLGDTTIYKCDASPTYLFASDIVIKRIKETVPDASNLKIITVMRNPLERLVSHYRHNVYRNNENRPLDEIINNELLQYLSDKEPRNLQYMGPCFYGFFLQKWKEKLGDASYLFLRTEDLNFSSEVVYTDLCEFLNVSDFCGSEFNKKNVSGEPKSKMLHNFVFGKSSSRNLLKSLVPIQYRSWLVQLFLEFNTNPSCFKGNLNSDLQSRLKEIYIADSLILEKNTGFKDTWF